jgi:hypothetical protein
MRSQWAAAAARPPRPAFPSVEPMWASHYTWPSKCECPCQSAVYLLFLGCIMAQNGPGGGRVNKPRGNVMNCQSAGLLLRASPAHRGSHLLPSHMAHDPGSGLLQCRCTAGALQDGGERTCIHVQCGCGALTGNARGMIVRCAGTTEVACCGCKQWQACSLSWGCCV